MDAKSFLSRAVELDYQITNMIYRLDELKALSGRCTGRLSGMPGGGGSKRPLEETITKIIETESRLDDEIDRLVNLKVEILEEIGKVNDAKLQQILTRRYVEGESWQKIESALDLSHRYAMTLHRRAIEVVQKNLNEKSTKEHENAQ